MNPPWGGRDGPETILGSRSFWCTAAIVGISPGTRSCLSHGSDLAFRGGGRIDSELDAAQLARLGFVVGRNLTMTTQTVMDFLPVLDTMMTSGLVTLEKV